MQVREGCLSTKVTLIRFSIFTFSTLTSHVSYLASAFTYQSSHDSKRERIRGIVGFWYLFEMQEACNHILNLTLVRASPPRDPLLHLIRRYLDNRQARICKR